MTWPASTPRSQCKVPQPPSTLSLVTNDAYSTDLDYAYLARYAEVRDGALTAVSASYTHLRVPSFPVEHFLHVAGRIRCSPSADVALSISVRAPNDVYQFEADHPLEAQSYGGEAYGTPPRVGLLFALGGPIPLLAEGDYTVSVKLDGQLCRELVFNVSSEAAG